MTRRTAREMAQDRLATAKRKREAVEARIESDHERADRLQEDVEEYDAILTSQSDLLTRTVNALRGNPPPLTSWSHHDIPELAAEKVSEIERLTAERDALAQIKRHINEVRNGTGWTVQIYGVLLQQCDEYGKTVDAHRAERAEAERDALAAQVARVESLAGQWARLAGTAINPNSREWLQACAATLRECLSGWPEMSAVLAGSTGQECVRVDPDPGHEDEGYSCVTHNCAWDECPANQEDQS